MDRPPYDMALNAIRHTLRDLYGYVPHNLGEELASHVHATVSDYQDTFLKDIGEAQ
jgi:hypothetical protein